MKAQSARPLLLLAMLLAGCDASNSPQAGQGSTTPAYHRVEEARPLDPGTVPVRVGELGSSFPACYAMARFRDPVVEEGVAVPVSAAPFEEARETGRIAADGQFFLCSRSHDQRWLAVVWDEAEGASRRCGVSLPAARRSDYKGPCRSGWVASALVRLESGIRHPEAAPDDRSSPPADPQSIPSGD
jgi:hypothetical protein